MVEVLNTQAKKHGLSVRAVEHTTGNWYEVRKGRKLVYRSPRSEEVACYFGRLEIAGRFK